MIWPATSRWARRLVELLIAIILAKFVIVSILSLATAAIANTNVANGQGQTFERMIAGSALLVLAAWSPFALMRLLPMMEVAAASVASQRSSMSAAAGSAGIQSPAGYMRQAMDRSSRSSTSPAYRRRPAERRTHRGRAIAAKTPAGSVAERPSGGARSTHTARRDLDRRRRHRLSDARQPQCGARARQNLRASDRRAATDAPPPAHRFRPDDRRLGRPPTDRPPRPTEVKRERGRASALSVRPARAARADRFAAAGPGDRDRRRASPRA